MKTNITRPELIPKDTHYAIIVFKGYVSEKDYIAYDSETEWKEDIKNMTMRKDRFAAFVASPATIEVEVIVKYDRFEIGE